MTGKEQRFSLKWGKWLKQQSKPLLSISACIVVTGGCCLALEPELDSDFYNESATQQQEIPVSNNALLPPLVDTKPQSASQLKKEKPAASNRQSNPPLILTGKVQTLQQAIDSEKATVDWYAWYLSARAYLSATGGIQCALGTPIKFYRNGKIEPLSFDAVCISSLLGKRFPLPANTKLDALILPVRKATGPPASPTEIYSRIQEKGWE